MYRPQMPLERKERRLSPSGMLLIILPSKMPYRGGTRLGSRFTIRVSRLSSKLTTETDKVSPANAAAKDVKIKDPIGTSPVKYTAKPLRKRAANPRYFPKDPSNSSMPVSIKAVDKAAIIKLFIALLLVSYLGKHYPVKRHRVC